MTEKQIAKKQAVEFRKITNAFCAAIKKYIKDTRIGLTDFSPVLETLPDAKVKEGYKIFALGSEGQLSRDGRVLLFSVESYLENQPNFVNICRSCSRERGYDKKLGKYREFGDFIDTPFTPSGIWQRLLLKNAERMLPLFGHDNYIRETVVSTKKQAILESFFNSEDYKREKADREKLFSGWEDLDFRPSVKMIADDPDLAKLQYCCAFYNGTIVQRDYVAIRDPKTGVVRFAYQSSAKIYEGPNIHY